MRVDFSQTDLQPLIQRVVEATVQTLENERRQFGTDRLSYPEAEAAGLLGVARHVLRDARRRGELTGSRVGKTVVYGRSELETFLQKQRLT